MLTSIVSTTVSATTTSAVSSASAGAISMVTGIGVPEYGVLAVVALIVLLSAKEILSASESWNKRINCSLNMSIMPLLVSFFAIVMFKVTEIF